ncbi:MAG: oxygen-independent coproporphyrinogen III oxidase [Thermoplasmata archaeon]
MKPRESSEITVDVIERYDRRVPRYTSYPPVPYWSDTYDPSDHADRLEASRVEGGEISLYVHLPFCIRRCLFCACNVKITRDEALPRRYLRALEQEADAVVAHLGKGREVSQFHLGGGTPTHLTPHQLRELTGMVRDRFDIQSEAELSLEVHPTVTSMEHMDALADLGFNRISMGVQDFDEEVQRRINRYQSYEETARLVEAARDRNFLSVNIDLVYGLPYQTEAGMAATMKRILTIRPDRLAVYSYAHLPQVFPHQRGFPPEVIATGRDKMRLFLLARTALLDAGYESVGFDHFCLPTDELWGAATLGTLQRNFMGYTTQAGKDLVALGVSGISDVQGGYAQNAKELSAYFERVVTRGLATHRGMRLSQEDLVRRDAIMGLLCNGRLQFPRLRDTYGAMAEVVIREALDTAPGLVAEGLIVENNGGGWLATDLGRIFGRSVASTFDAYTRAAKETPAFSRGV